MHIALIWYAEFRDVFGDETVVEIPETGTILDAIQILIHTIDPDTDILTSGDGSMRSHVMIMYHGRRILPRDAGSIILKEGDRIILFPPVSGG